MSEPAQSSVGLTMEQWLALVERGANIPVTIPIMGVSMLPLIRYKIDPATIVPLRREPKEGDIVLFRRFGDGVAAVHRVFRVTEDGVQTWGDNCPKPDHPVGREDVLGLVVSIRRNGQIVPLDTEEQRRRGVRWMRSPIRRRLWLLWNRGCWFMGNLIRRVFPDFHFHRGNAD